MRLNISFFITATVFFLSFNTAQSKTVEVTVVGTGNTYEDAKNNALRSALEQVSGVFLSSNTSVTNDVVEKDEISTLTNGTIKKYVILNKSSYEEGYSVTIFAVVSPENLAQYVSNRRSLRVEVDGNLFLTNAKQMQLNRNAEEKALANICAVFNKMMNYSYDYVDVNATKPMKKASYDIQVDVAVTFKVNKNINSAKKYLFDNLKSISLKQSEVEDFALLTGQKAHGIILLDEIIYFRGGVKGVDHLLKALETAGKAWGHFKINDGYETYNLGSYNGEQMSNLWTMRIPQTYPYQNNLGVCYFYAKDGFHFPKNGEKNVATLIFHYNEEGFAKVSGFKVQQE